MGRRKTELEKAIQALSEEYNKALGLDFVLNPIAYALYRTWKQFDIKEKPTQEYKCEDCEYYKVHPYKKRSGSCRIKCTKYYSDLRYGRTAACKRHFKKKE